MRAQILSIGEELLGGYITDTNSTFLEQQLALLNIPVTLVTQVGDSRDRIAEVIIRAMNDADIVVCTGGVGPTASPSLITNATRARAATSTSGSPSTAITSASRPGANRPSRSSTPSASAATPVAARIARAGGQPQATIVATSAATSAKARVPGVGSTRWSFVRPGRRIGWLKELSAVLRSLPLNGFRVWIPTWS